MTEYTVIRSKRKTAVVEIRDDLQVIVRVPYYLSNALIQELIQKQEPLIDRKLAQMKGQSARSRPLRQKRSGSSWIGRFRRSLRAWSIMPD